MKTLTLSREKLMWADPESRSDAEMADAATKKMTVGVPWRQLMEDLDYTPVQIARMRTERAADAMLAVASQPVAVQQVQQANPAQPQDNQEVTANGPPSPS